MLLLCVDDEPVALEVRKQVLERQGFKVLTATNGNYALQLFATNPIIRAVILDYAMPGMNGAELAAELRRLKPQTRIMMLSAYHDLPRTVSNLVDVAAVKGTSPTRFLSAVQRLLS
jgi:CheY-like chemotaxis protein